MLSAVACCGKVTVYSAVLSSNLFFASSWLLTLIQIKNEFYVNKNDCVIHQQKDHFLLVGIYSYSEIVTVGVVNNNLATIHRQYYKTICMKEDWDS